jgi:hypothetical protein
MALIERAKKILLSPKQEWAVIDGEAATPQQLYVGYVLPLAAVGPLASMIGMSLFGVGIGPLHFRVPFGVAIRGAVVQYVLTLISIFVVALIIDALAPSFGGQKSSIQALKVAVYSMTAAWLAGIFAIIPMLAILGIVGLYSFYLLYLGLPVLMKAPADKAVVYTIVVVVCAVVLFLITSAVVGALGMGASRFMP